MLRRMAKTSRFVFVSLLALLFLVAVAWAQDDCTITAKSTAEFMSAIPGINTMLSTCDGTLPWPLNWLFGSETINIQVVMQDGTKSVFAVVTAGGKATSVAAGGSDKPTFVITLGQCEFDTILRSDDKMGVMSFLYTGKKIIVGPVGWWKNLVFNGVMLFAGGPLKKAAVETPVACSTPGGTAQGKLPVGAVCNNGGECESGNCLGVIPGQLYKCSCDPFKYVELNPCPPPAQPPQGTHKKIGETCNHGGECESGNCLGVIPGQLYKCSCDPFTYKEIC
jgi:hypothetical protein